MHKNTIMQIANSFTHVTLVIYRNEIQKINHNIKIFFMNRVMRFGIINSL